MIQDSEPKCDECGHILPLAGPCANCGTRPNRLRVYVAGAYRDRERVTRWMREARDRGLHVEHDWVTAIDSVKGEDRDVPPDNAREYALGDIDAIARADVFWLLTPPEGQGRGSWVELGVAYQMTKPVIVSGVRSADSIFTALGLRFTDDFHALRHIIMEHTEWRYRPGSAHEVGNEVAGEVPNAGPPPVACGGCTPDPVPYETATGDTYPAKGVWQNPDRQGGKPCIEGTRIPTMAIAELFASGKSTVEIAHSYPSLLRDANPRVYEALRKAGVVLDGLSDPLERLERLEPETLDVEQLVGCNVEVPGCVVETGEYCGEDPCPHDEAAERICPDCGNGASPGTHADDCPKVPQLRALLRLLDANERMQRVHDLLAAHDGNAPPSAYETLRRIREVIGG